MQRLKTCTWAELHAVESTVQHHAWVYNCVWHSMPNLGADDTLLSQYKVLEHQDLKIDTTVIAPDVHGQWNKLLPWFWFMDIQRDADVGVWMSDCRCTSVYMCSDICSTNESNCSLLSALAEGKGSKDAVD